MIVKGEADAEYRSRLLPLGIYFLLYNMLVPYTIWVLYTIRVLYNTRNYTIRETIQYKVITMWYILPYLYNVQYIKVKYIPLFPKSSWRVPEEFPQRVPTEFPQSASL
jgi:hypothetical protein